MQDFRKLQVWKKSHDLTLRIYEITSQFPREETYGLTSQIRRSSASIPTNIAEGCGREGAKEYQNQKLSTENQDDLVFGSGLGFG